VRYGDALVVVIECQKKCNILERWMFIQAGLSKKKKSIVPLKASGERE
jgi:hypothetical protein